MLDEQDDGAPGEAAGWTSQDTSRSLVRVRVVLDSLLRPGDAGPEQGIQHHLLPLTAAQGCFHLQQAGRGA
jgi:hypothetical protein